MGARKRAVLMVDYRNMYCAARDNNHDFHVIDLVLYVEKKYDVRREDVFIFMSESFFGNMYEPAKKKVEGIHARLRLPSRTRTRGGFDPVDKAIIRLARQQLRRKDIEALVIASSDGDFASLGEEAWHRNKDYDVVCYDDPSHKLLIAANNVVELKKQINPHVRR